MVVYFKSVFIDQKIQRKNRMVLVGVSRKSTNQQKKKSKSKQTLISSR